MTLIERLRNPTWTGGPNESDPQTLDVRLTVNDMKEAADILERREKALIEVREKAIVAGAAFVRRNKDGADRCSEVLDIIDSALR